MIEYFHVTAGQNSAIDGCRITDFIGQRGSAPLQDRRWNTTGEFGDGWVGPLYRHRGGPGGAPCFDFDSKAGLKNFIGFDTPPLDGAATFFIVAKIRMFSPNTIGTNFLFTNGPGTRLSLRPSLVNGTRRLAFASPTIEANLPVDKAFEEGRFSALVLVVNGHSSRIKIGQNPIITLPLDPFAYRGLIMGRSYLNRNSGPGFDGLISEWGMFSQALNDEQVEELFMVISRNLY